MKKKMMKKKTATRKKAKAKAKTKTKPRARRKKTAARARPARRTAARRGKTPAHAYQEGSVESLSERPAGGADGDDRSGGGTRPAGGRGPTENGRDSFVSSEVGGRTSTPGRDPRTRS